MDFVFQSPPSSSLIHPWFQNLHSASKLDSMVKKFCISKSWLPHKLWTQTTPSLLLQADKRLAAEGTHWNIIDDVPDTHKMSSKQTQDYYTAKNIQGKLTICILQRLLFLGWFRNNLWLNQRLLWVNKNKPQWNPTAMHHVTSILVNAKYTWVEMMHKAIIIICFRLLIG